MDAFKSAFSCQTVNFLTNEIYGLFCVANPVKARKAIDNVRFILNKIHLSLFSASLRRLFSHSFPAFDHFGVLLL